MDKRFNQLQNNMEQEARKNLIASGQQHLLSYYLLDVCSHQVPGLPFDTTPDIVQFIANISGMALKTKIHRPSLY